MLHLFLIIFVFAVLLLILTISAKIGRWFGRKQLKLHPHHKLEVVAVAETSVFGLLALLIAFTFSGAYDRFENRKIHIIEEANAYDAALYNISLVAPQYQPELSEKIRQYIDLHLTAYHHLPHFKQVEKDLDQALQLEHEIWKIAVNASKNNPNESLAQVFIESINKMFDAAHTGMNLAKVHPPGIIFLLMISLAGLGSFLIGYDSAETNHKRPIHTSSYIFLTAITIYIIFNLEFPRTGFLDVQYFDQMIVDIRNHTNTAFASIFPF
jgi:hypothetical protein